MPSLGLDSWSHVALTPVRWVVSLKEHVDSVGRELASLFVNPARLTALPVFVPPYDSPSVPDRGTGPGSVSQDAVLGGGMVPSGGAQQPQGVASIVKEIVREVVKAPIINNYYTYTVTNPPTPAPSSASDSSFLSQLSSLRQEMAAALRGRVETSGGAPLGFSTNRYEELFVTKKLYTGSSGNIQIIDSSGRIPELSSTYFSSVPTFFSSIGDSSGAVQFSASSTADLLSFAGAGGTGISFDPTQNKITITQNATSTSSTLAGVLSNGADASTFTGTTTLGGNISVLGSATSTISGPLVIGDTSVGYRVAINGNVDAGGADLAVYDRVSSGGAVKIFDSNSILKHQFGGAAFNIQNAANLNMYSGESTGNVFSISGTSGNTSIAGNLTVSGSATSTIAGPLNVPSLNNGAANITLASSGNVGIGTTSPGALLEVSSAASTDGIRVIGGTALGASSGGSLRIAANAQPTAANQRLGLLSFGFYNGSSSVVLPGIAAFSSQAWSGTAAGSYLSFYTVADNAFARSERLRIDSSGNVGIGTTSPSALLHVTASSTNTLLVNNTGTGAIADFQAGGNSKLYVGTNGNVGIGTGSPGTRSPVAGAYLDVISSSRAGVGIGGNATSDTVVGDLNFYNDAISSSSDKRIAIIAGWRLGNDNTGALGFFTRNAAGTTQERMRISPPGNVGIGSAVVSQPLALLHLSYASSSTMLLGNQTGTGGLIDLQKSGVSQFSVNNSGNATLTGALTVNGSATSTFAGPLTTSGSVNSSQGYYFGGIRSPLSIELSRTVPTTVDDYVEIGNFNLTSGAHNIRLSVTVSNGGFSIAKTYVAPVSYTATTNSWQKLVPSYATQAYVSNDVDVDINVNTDVAYFRLRRSGGSIAGTAYIRIESTGATSDVFRATAATGSTTAPTDLYGALYQSFPYYSNQVSLVGIGTTSPGSKLTIRGINNLSSHSSLNVQNASSTSLLFVRNDGNVGIGTTSPSALLHATASSTNTLLVNNTGTSNATNAVADFQNSGTSRLFIATNGNVGIGTNNPGAKLSVLQTSGMGALEFGNLSGGTYIQSYDRVGLTYKDLRIRTNNTGGVGDTAIFTSTGNLGIGTTVPGSLLSVAGGVAIGSVYATSTAPTNGLIVQGNVGIGTSSPGAPLEIRSSASPLGLRLSYDASNYWDIVSTYNLTNPDLVFKVNGSEKFRIDNQGKVGIGTTSPSAPLHVTASSTNTLLVNNTGTGAIADFQAGGNSKLYVGTNGNVGIGTGSPGALLEVSSAASTNGIRVIGGTALGASSGGSLRIAANAQPTAANQRLGLLSFGFYDGSSSVALPGMAAFSSQAWSGTAAGSYLSFYTVADNAFARSERLRIDASGNVGLATTTPSSRLTIQGSDSTSANSSLGVYNSSQSPLLFVRNDGNVGIGTTGPNYKLDVIGGASAAHIDGLTVLEAPSGVTLSQLRMFNVAGSGTWAIGNKNSGGGDTDNLHFTSYGVHTQADRMVITGAGNVGIGTTSPSTKLEVNGAASSTSLTTGTINYTAATADNNTTQCRNSSGQLAGCTSLAKWKESVEPLSTGLATILALRPVEFDWKSASSSSPLYRHDLGFIAEEVAAVNPLLARYTDQGVLEGVRYGQMSALTVKAIQELNLKLEPVLATTTPQALVQGPFALASQALQGALTSLGNMVVHTFDKAIWAANGIFDNIFAREVRTDKLCVGDVCVTRDQLKALLEKEATSSHESAHEPLSEASAQEETAAADQPVPVAGWPPHSSPPPFAPSALIFQPLIYLDAPPPPHISTFFRPFVVVILLLASLALVAALLSVAPRPARLACDLNGDNQCDIVDVSLFEHAFGKCGQDLRTAAALRADADYDGCVTEKDLALLFPESRRTAP